MTLPQIRSLKVRVLLAFAAAFLVVGVGLTHFLSVLLRNDTQQMLATQQYSYVDSLATELDGKISRDIDGLERVARLLSTDVTGSSQIIARHLAARVGIHGVFTGGLMVTDKSGKVLGEFPGNQRTGTNLTGYDFLEQTLQTGRPVISNPFWSPYLETGVITLAVPIFDKNDMVGGALLGVIPLNQPNFLGKATEHRVGSGGGIDIVAPVTRTIITSTDKDRVFVPAPDRGVAPMLDRYIDGYDGAGVGVNAQGIEELSAAKHLTTAGWVMMVHLPTAEAFAPIHRMNLRLAGGMVLLFAVSLAILWLVLKRSVRPLSEANRLISRMALGEIPLAAVPVSGDREVTRLLTSFNALQSKIVEAEDELWNSHEALREREAVYHSLFEGCRAVEMLIDPTDGRIIDANQAACSYYGWPHQIMTRKVMSDINTLSPEEIAAEMARARNNERDHFHFRHRLASGEIRDVEVWAGPVKVNGRELLYSIVHDVTARRQTEHHLRETKARLELVLSAAAEGIYGVDCNNQVIFANQATATLLGWNNPQEMLGMLGTQALGHRTNDGQPCTAHTCAVRMTLVDGQTRRVAHETFSTAKGTFIPVEYVVSALSGEAGIVGAVVVFRDVTQQITAAKALQQRQEKLVALATELARSNAELEHFAYVASHDLRQPLRMVAGHLTLLDRRLKDRLSPDEEASLGFAVDGAKRMDRMIVDLLDYSRLGRAKLATTLVDLGAVAQRAVSNLGIAIREAQATVTLPPAMPSLQGRTAELERLFQNLIANAIKFRAADRLPVVEVTCQDQTEFWHICVTDNGIGIEQDNLNRLFQLFQRLVSREEYDGTGIGLASCRKICEHHGGRIWVESQLGVGSVFHIALPKQGMALMDEVDQGAHI